MNVFTQVTPIGNRGSAGGGQNADCKRKIRNDPISPLNSIISDAITIRIASIPLLMNGRSLRSLEPKSVDAARRTGISGRTFELDDFAPVGIAVLVRHQNCND